MRYTIEYKLAGVEMEWTTIASYSSPRPREKHLINLVDNSEKYRSRNSIGVVFSGPLYKPVDVEDEVHEYHEPSYIPDQEQIERLVTLIRSTNNLTKMDSTTNFRQSPGRAANEVTVIGGDGELEPGDNVPDHDPWWVQIGG